MKRRLVVLVLVGVAILLPVGALAYIFFFSPRADFTRHFGYPIPQSVEEISVSGYTALAGSDETLVFRISSADLETIVARRKFPEVTEGVKDSMAADVLIDTWKRHIAHAENFDIQVGRFFEITEDENSVYYILIADADSDWVYYHYFKL